MESKELQVDPHGAKIGEIDDRKIEKYVTHVPFHHNSSNLFGDLAYKLSVIHFDEKCKNTQKRSNLWRPLAL